MKKFFVALLMLLTIPAFATGVGSTASTADCDNATLNTYTGTSNLSAGWQPNTIDLHWYADSDTTTEMNVATASQSCTYDGTLTPPATIPTKTGYTFKGWKVRPDVPSGYTRLQYIESTGTQYLLIPYRVNNKTVLYCKYNETGDGPNVANAIFGVTDQPDVAKANNGVLRLTGSKTTTTSFNRMGWGGTTSGSVIDVSAPKTFGVWYEVLYNQNKLYQDGTLYATSSTSNSTTWTANYSLGVFARNGSSVSMLSKVKISSLYAKESNEYKVFLIPAKRNSDNVVGMYDTVSKTFFTNAGTGSFIAGPVVQ